MAETKNLGGLADAIFAEIDRLQDPELADAEGMQPMRR